MTTPTINGDWPTAFSAADLALLQAGAESAAWQAKLRDEIASLVQTGATWPQARTALQTLLDEAPACVRPLQ